MEAVGAIIAVVVVVNAAAADAAAVAARIGAVSLSLSSASD